MASNGKFSGPRGRHRRGGPHPGRPRPRGEGLLQGRPRLDAAGEDLHRADRARRDRRLRGRGRRRRLRPAVRRAGDQHRPQRLARGRPADRDPRDDRRPPVRLRPAGGELRRRAGRLRRPRRRHRRRRRAHGPHLVRRLGCRSCRSTALAFSPAAARALQPGPAGDLGRDDRRPVGDPPLGARRARRCARSSSPRGRPRRAASTARSFPFQVNGDTYTTDQGIRPDTNLETLSQLKTVVQGGRQDHRRQLLADLRRRRRGAADDPREGRRARPARRGRGSSTRRRSASTR